MKINFALCAIFLSSSLIAAHEDVLTSRKLNLRKLEDTDIDVVTDDGAEGETYEAVEDDVNTIEEEVNIDDTNTTEEEVVENEYGVEEEAANPYGSAYYDSVASDDKLEEAETELEDAEEDLEQADEALEQAEEEVEEFMEEEEAEVQEEVEQSYAMKYSSSSNTFSIIGSLTGFSIVALVAVSVKKRIFPEKKSDVFLRMEDDNLSVLA